MNLEAEKLNVLQQIIITNDLGLIRDIKGLLNNRNLDWFDGLNKSQKKDVEIGLSQLDKGIFLTHEEVKKKFWCLIMNIIWSTKAVETLQKNVDYLLENWPEVESKKFLKRVFEYLEMISSAPFIARKTFKTKHTYIGVIIPQI